jgi:hypothetical protein
MEAVADAALIANTVEQMFVGFDESIASQRKKLDASCPGRVEGLPECRPGQDALTTHGKTLLGLAKKVHDLHELVEKTNAALDKLNDRLRVVEKEMATMQGREALLIERAKGATSTAASTVAMGGMADLARRIGQIEAQIRRLPPPEA